MPKTCTEDSRQTLAGATMGTRWSVRLDGPAAPDGLHAALQAAVDEVDMQMSTWKPDSALMRLNAAPCGAWVAVPARLLAVLAAGLAISRATGGAFEMNVGDAVRAWGFGADRIDLAAIRAASAARRVPATEALEIDAEGSRVRKSAPLALDLSGIAKGYGVDRLAEVLADHGVSRALCVIDGEVRAIGTQADGSPWAVAVENPDGGVHSVLALADASVATSGDYRHFVTVAGTRLAHTIDPRRGAPLVGAPCLVSVVAPSCMLADALATALTVMGPEQGLAHARQHGLSALILTRGAQGLETAGCGLFAA